MSSGRGYSRWGGGCSLSQPQRTADRNSGPSGSLSPPPKGLTLGLDTVKSEERLMRATQEVIKCLASTKAARSPCVLPPLAGPWWVGGCNPTHLLNFHAAPFFPTLPSPSSLCCFALYCQPKRAKPGKRGTGGQERNGSSSVSKRGSWEQGSRFSLRDRDLIN